MNVDFLIRLRDACQMLADAANQEIERMAPKESGWNPEKIKWVQAEGSKGTYQRYPAQDEKAESTSDFWNMLADLRAHKGKLTRDGLFYWLFSDGATVGRKKK